MRTSRIRSHSAANLRSLALSDAPRRTLRNCQKTTFRGLWGLSTAAVFAVTRSILALQRLMQTLVLVLLPTFPTDAQPIRDKARMSRASLSTPSLGRAGLRLPPELIQCSTILQCSMTHRWTPSAEICIREMAITPIARAALHRQECPHQQRTPPLTPQLAYGLPFRSRSAHGRLIIASMWTMRW